MSHDSLEEKGCGITYSSLLPLGRGYCVTVNTPFSNSKTVDTPAHYKSLMIEVNKRVYMYENDLKKKMPEFYRLKAQMETLYYRLLD